MSRSWIPMALYGLVVLLAAGYLVSLGVRFFTLSGPYRVDCSQVGSFLGGSIPERATGVVCQDDGTVLDLGYIVEFRMPREDLADWLPSVLPKGPEFSKDDLCKTDACFRSWPQDRAGEDRDVADYMTVAVTYEDDRTALVHVHAFNI